MKLKQAVLAGAAVVLAAGGASAQISGDVVKIGVLNDQSSLYADITGPGSVAAARLASQVTQAEAKYALRKEVRLKKVRVWETATSWAEYEAD